MVLIFFKVNGKRQRIPRRIINNFKLDRARLRQHHQQQQIKRKTEEGRNNHRLSSRIPFFLNPPAIEMKMQTIQILVAIQMPVP